MGTNIPATLTLQNLSNTDIFSTENNTESILDVYEQSKGSLEDEKMISLQKDSKEDKQKKALRGRRH